MITLDFVSSTSDTANAYFYLDDITVSDSIFDSVNYDYVLYIHSTLLMKQMETIKENEIMNVYFDNSEVYNVARVALMWIMEILELIYK